MKKLVVIIVMVISVIVLCSCNKNIVCPAYAMDCDTTYVPTSMN